jgi:hypothetical protein
MLEIFQPMELYGYSLASSLDLELSSEKTINNDAQPIKSESSNIEIGCRVISVLEVVLAKEAGVFSAREKLQ